MASNPGAARRVQGTWSVRTMRPPSSSKQCVNSAGSFTFSILKLPLSRARHQNIRLGSIVDISQPRLSQMFHSQNRQQPFGGSSIGNRLAAHFKAAIVDSLDNAARPECLTYKISHIPYTRSVQSRAALS